MKITFALFLLACLAASAADSDLEDPLEIKVVGGFNEVLSSNGSFLFSSFGASEHGSAYSVGAEAAWGINRFLAVTGEYGFNRLKNLEDVCGFLGCFDTQTSRKVTNAMAGVRVSLPTDSRWTPYGKLTVGAVRSFATVDRAFLANPADRRDVTHFAFGFGVGVNFAVRQNWGLSGTVDWLYPVRTTRVASVSTLENVALIRPTGGIYFRF